LICHFGLKICYFLQRYSCGFSAKLIKFTIYFGIGTPFILTKANASTIAIIGIESIIAKADVNEKNSKKHAIAPIAKNPNCFNVSGPTILSSNSMNCGT